MTFSKLGVGPWHSLSITPYRTHSSRTWLRTSYSTVHVSRSQSPSRDQLDPTW